MRLLKSDTFRTFHIGLIWLLALMLLWGLWFFGASMTLYETSVSARLEINEKPYSIQSTVTGRVTLLKMAVGTTVSEGQLLIQIDPESERIGAEKAASDARALEGQVEMLRKELAFREKLLSDQSQASAAALNEAMEKAKEAESSALVADTAAAKARALFEQGLSAEMETTRLIEEAKQRRANAEGLRLAAEKMKWENRVKENELRSAVEHLNSEIMATQGDLSEETAEARRQQNEVAKHNIIAPADGRIGETADLHVGMVVTQGQKLATLIPGGGVKIVGYFPPASLGRIHKGQAGQFSLDGFPWAEYGKVKSIVTYVSEEPRDGKVQVELAIQNDSNHKVPLEHGLPGTVEVAVERTTPAVLLWRSVGKLGST